MKGLDSYSVTVEADMSNATMISIDGRVSLHLVSNHKSYHNKIYIHLGRTTTTCQLALSGAVTSALIWPDNGTIVSLSPLPLHSGLEYTWRLSPSPVIRTASDPLSDVITMMSPVLMLNGPEFQ